MKDRVLYFGTALVFVALVFSYVSIDGVLFAQTRSTTRETITPTKIIPLFTRTLERGVQSDPDVLMLQQNLKTLGYYSFDVNGIFGPLTESALRAFQGANGILETGIFNLETRNALLRALNASRNELPLVIRKKNDAEPVQTQSLSAPCRLFVNTLPKIQNSYTVNQGETLLTPAAWFSVRADSETPSCDDVSITSVDLVVRKSRTAPKLNNIEIFRASNVFSNGAPDGSVVVEGGLVTSVVFGKPVALTTRLLGDYTETFHVYAKIPTSAPSGSIYKVFISGINAQSSTGGAVIISNESFRFAPTNQRTIIVD